MRLIGSGCKRSNVCSWRILIDRRLNQILNVLFGWIIFYLLSSFECIISYISLSGDNGKEVTPVPMPNTEVKLFSADGSRTYVPQE